MSSSCGQDTTGRVPGKNVRMMPVSGNCHYTVWELRAGATGTLGSCIGGQLCSHRSPDRSIGKESTQARTQADEIRVVPARSQPNPNILRANGSLECERAFGGLVQRQYTEFPRQFPGGGNRGNPGAVRGRVARRFCGPRGRTGSSRRYISAVFRMNPSLDLMC